VEAQQEKRSTITEAELNLRQRGARPAMHVRFCPPLKSSLLGFRTWPWQDVCVAGSSGCTTCTRTNGNPGPANWMHLHQSVVAGIFLHLHQLAIMPMPRIEAFRPSQCKSFLWNYPGHSAGN
jgi:hypothetical protein